MNINKRVAPFALLISKACVETPRSIGQRHSPIRSVRICTAFTQNSGWFLNSSSHLQKNLDSASPATFPSLFLQKPAPSRLKALHVRVITANFWSGATLQGALDEGVSTPINSRPWPWIGPSILDHLSSMSIKHHGNPPAEQLILTDRQGGQDRHKGSLPLMTVAPDQPSFSRMFCTPTLSSGRRPHILLSIPNL